MVGGEIPEDVVRDILSRLAVKSLLRFRCVHSTWNSLLKSSSFVAAHLHLNRNRAHGDGDGNGNGGSSLVLAKYELVDGSKGSRLRMLNPQTYSVYRDVEIPFASPPPKQHPWFEVAGSCNGLVCLFASGRGSKQQLCLYNPCLRQHNMIPQSPIAISISHLGDQNRRFVFGFAYDSVINDYKVVSLVSQGEWEYSPERRCYIYNRCSNRAEVYTLGTNRWREVGTGTGLFLDDHVQYDHLIGSNQAMVGGAIHWLAGSDHSPPTGDLILSFDVSSEVFRLFWLPPPITVHGGYDDEMRIDVHGDCLCLVRLFNAFVPFTFSCDIWVMKEYGVDESWTKLYADICLSNISMTNPADFLGIGINGELVFNHNVFGNTGLTLLGLTLVYPDAAATDDDDDDDQKYRYKDVNFFFNQGTFCGCIPSLVTNFVESLVSPSPDLN